MKRAGQRWSTWAAALLCAAVPALCCGPFFPDAIFVRTHQPDAPYARFAAGRLGVLQPGYRVRHLAIAYDYLSGRPLNAAEQKDAVRVNAMLASEVDTQPPAPGFAAWLAARKAFGAVDDVTDVSPATDRSIPGVTYQQFPNCLDDAFANAANTLAARQASHGAHSTEVVEWVRGQDAVFLNCGDTPASFTQGSYHPATPPPITLPARLNTAPEWLLQDRAYQIAAAQFYALQYADALKSFRAIAADRSSPWSTIAEYLTARTMIRQATIGSATVEDNFNGTQQQRDQAHNDEIAELVRVQSALKAMRDEPRMQPLHPAIDHLLDWLAIRVDPKAQALVLAARLNTQGDANFGQDLIDLSFVADQIPRTPSHPGQTGAVTDAQPGSLLWAWIAAVSSQDEPTALANWHAHHSTAWLLAALMAAKPGAAANAQLLQQAAELPAFDPAYVAVTYQRLRLMPADAAMRAELEKVRPAIEADEGPSAANLFAALDAASAPTLHAWLRTAGRKPAIITDGDGTDEDLEPAPDSKPKEQICGPPLVQSNVPLFTPPAADALNTGMPLTVLADAAESNELAPNLRFALAQSTWTRAVLLNRPEIARRMTPLMVSCRVAWKEVLSAYDGARDPHARHVAALLALMRFASTEPDVRAGSERPEGFATYSEFRDNWWFDTVTASPSAMANFNGGAASADQSGNQTPLVSSELSFLSPQEHEAARREVEALLKIPPASDYFAEEALAWWRKHPNDPADAELLGEAMRVNRNAPRTHETAENEHALFEALHRAFPQNEWAKRYSSWE